MSMSSSTSVQHFSPPFASLSTGAVGLRPSWLSHLQSQQQQQQQQLQPQRPYQHHQKSQSQSEPHHPGQSPPPADIPSHRALSHPNGLDTLAEGSQYVLNRLQLSRVSDGGTLSADAINKEPPYGAENQTSSMAKASSGRDLGPESRGPAKRKSATSAPVRRRISRACDQCNQLRTKCDGQSPCAHCIEFGLTCEYARERKKRGKASKKDLAQQAALAATSSNASANPDLPVSPVAGQHPLTEKPPTHEPGSGFDSASDSSRRMADPKPPQLQPSTSITSMPNAGQRHQHQQLQQLGHSIDNSTTIANFAPIPDMSRPGYDLRPAHGMHGGTTTTTTTTTQSSPPPLAQQPLSGYHDNSYPMMNPQEHHQPSPLNDFRFGHAGENGSVPPLMGLTPPAQSPGWPSLPSPPPANYPPFPSMPNVTNPLRYPVLQPLLPHITSVIPQSLACDLLDLYFASSSSTHLCPQSPYVVGFFFRKQSILHPTRPRACSPALLASMLWVGAQTSDAAFLTSPPSARGRVCQKLLELTIGLLKPLIHGPAPGETSPNYAANMVINGVALGGFGVSMDQLGAESGATGAIDDVATYIHLATVVSASEYKGASIRWWTAAWSLARELKLGRELPPDACQPLQEEMATGGRDGDMEINRPPHLANHHSNNAGGVAQGAVTEEEREERRRIWWLLYTMDRHLALCYNRPLILLDKECENLLQPMPEILFQTGDFSSPQSTSYRRAGPPLECTDHSMFGYFLPLMTILGEIVELNMARNHPRFGTNFRGADEWQPQVAEITRQLEMYGQSLRDFEARHTNTAGMGGLSSLEEHNNVPCQDGQQVQDVVSPSGKSTSTTGSRVTESIVQTKIVVAYGTHIMHVLHILLTGKWDPISLLDDNDLWISSESFIQSMGHAVGASEAVADILEHDPDFSFMPFFFGVYLLQGSFLLLLTAEKLQGDANPSVVRACETIVRAHESLVSTLSTQYQRNFRKVMRSALAQVRGRMPDDFGEQQQRRREVLSLYRWTADGSGIAL